MGPTRDDFTKTTKAVIAGRAGYRCSAPNCGRGTSKPDAVDSSGSINQGVAAHIHAASPGGPRYDPDMTKDERSAPENGIWLCQNCAKVIDSSEQMFPASVLKTWKQKAEEVAARNSRGGADEIGNLIVEIDETNGLIVRVVLWARQNQPDFWFQMIESQSDEERAELRRKEMQEWNRVHAQMQAAYQELIAPRIHSILTRSARLLGHDNGFVKNAASSSLGAATNQLSLEDLGEQILKIRAELLLR